MGSGPPVRLRCPDCSKSMGPFDGSPACPGCGRVFAPASGVWDLLPRSLEAAKSNTTSNITTAEKNLQAAAGKQLNAAQKDLIEKINGFLGQAHEAIVADDWVRAQNLADKARVLSNELVKSL